MSERLILSPEQQRERALQRAAFVERVQTRFELFKLLFAEEYRLARGDMRRNAKEKGAKKDEKFQLEIRYAIDAAIKGADAFMAVHMAKPEKADEVAKAAEAQATAEATADKQADLGTAPAAPAPAAETVSPGGIVLP